MKLESHITHNTCTITLTGDFDAEGVQNTREKIEAICLNQNYRHVAINLRLVNFLDSSGVGALVYLFKRLKANNCEMSLLEVQGQPGELIQLLRINQAMDVQWANSTANTQNTRLAV